MHARETPQASVLDATVLHDSIDLSIMFLPSAVEENKAKKDERKAAFQNIEQWALGRIPDAIRHEAQVSIQEFECGDPMCAPIDTAVTILFNR